ncbi:MAG: hypothetical protein E6J20_02210 [Chloroflexi bacterium]|nr:MAG: hypothetical protein E6J20_02210 [Chloroflexota bacterium]
MVLALLVLVVAGTSAWAIFRWPIAWSETLIWVLALQNAVVITVWVITKSATVGRDLLYVKEALVAGAIVVGVVEALRLVAAGRGTAILWLALAFGGLCAIWVPISYFRHEPLEQIARGLRSVAYPVLLLVVGMVMIPPGGVIRLRRTLWLTAIVLGAAVIVERDFIPTRFWLDINLQKYWVDVKGISPSFLNGGLPWNFFLQINTGVVRRGVGIMTDPLDLSYYLLLPFALALSELCRPDLRGHQVWLPGAAALFSAIGVMWTLSRAPIAILVAIAIAVPAFEIYKRRQLLTRAIATPVAAALILGVIGALALATATRVSSTDLFQSASRGQTASPAPIVSPSSGQTASPTSPESPSSPSATSAPIAPLGSDTLPTHVSATIDRVRSNWHAVVFGGGLGSAGVLSSKFIAANLSSYENFYLDTSAQVSIIGGLLVAAILVWSAVTLMRAGLRDGDIRFPAGVTLGALAAAGMVSDQLEVLTSLGLTWFICGVLLREAFDSARGPRPDQRTPENAQAP